MKQLRNFNKRDIPDAVKESQGFSDAMQKYGHMSEDALIESLLSQIRGSKKNGTYNPAQMEGYINMLKPHLGEAQREKLQNIIKVINSEAD
ncbi:MAG: hypothetical protein FWH03_03895 [Firmicutes bacterium]|nr:hypothetical protein [Bacillota bacterium]